MWREDLADQTFGSVAPTAVAYEGCHVLPTVARAAEPYCPCLAVTQPRTKAGLLARVNDKKKKKPFPPHNGSDAHKKIRHRRRSIRLASEEETEGRCGREGDKGGRRATA